MPLTLSRPHTLPYHASFEYDDGEGGEFVTPPREWFLPTTNWLDWVAPDDAYREDDTEVGNFGTGELGFDPANEGDHCFNQSPIHNAMVRLCTLPQGHAEHHMSIAARDRDGEAPWVCLGEWGRAESVPAVQTSVMPAADRTTDSLGRSFPDNLEDLVVTATSWEVRHSPGISLPYPVATTQRDPFGDHCEARSAEYGWNCTRTGGHDGPHRAGIGLRENGYVLGEWDIPTAVAPAAPQVNITTDSLGNPLSSGPRSIVATPDSWAIPSGGGIRTMPFGVLDTPTGGRACAEVISRYPGRDDETWPCTRAAGHDGVHRSHWAGNLNAIVAEWGFASSVTSTGVPAEPTTTLRLERYSHDNYHDAGPVTFTIPGIYTAADGWDFPNPENLPERNDVIRNAVRLAEGYDSDARVEFDIRDNLIVVSHNDTPTSTEGAQVPPVVATDPRFAGAPEGIWFESISDRLRVAVLRPDGRAVLKDPYGRWSDAPSGLVYTDEIATSYGYRRVADQPAAPDIPAAPPEDPRFNGAPEGIRFEQGVGSDQVLVWLPDGTIVIKRTYSNSWPTGSSGSHYTEQALNQSRYTRVTTPAPPAQVNPDDMISKAHVAEVMRRFALSREGGDHAIEAMTEAFERLGIELDEAQRATTWRAEFTVSVPVTINRTDLNPLTRTMVQQALPTDRLREAFSRLIQSAKLDGDTYAGISVDVDRVRLLVDSVRQER